MRLLILGGTSFVGRHLAEAALDRGWSLSLFHRGKTNPDLFPSAVHLLGDRLDDLTSLHGKRWDAVVDTSAYIPRAVRLAGEALSSCAERLAFVSTISVYSDPNNTSVDSDLAGLDDPSTEEVTSDTYGGLKVLCEQEVIKYWGERAWILRPGIIAGPYDPTDRFTYWIDRVANYEAFTKPARLNQPVQCMDARALAEFALDGLVSGHSQTVNLVGPQAPMDFDHLLKRIRRELRAPNFELLASQGTPLPLELPRENDNMFRVDPQPAIDLGLKLPSIRETIRSTYEWWQEQTRELKTSKPNLADRRRP